MVNFDNRESPSDWAMVAWVTGHVSLFKIVTNELVTSCNVDDTQSCLTRSGVSLEGRLPYGLSGQYSSRLLLTLNVKNASKGWWLNF